MKMKKKEKMRAQIVRIAKCDAYYDNKDLLIGLKGVIEPYCRPRSAWIAGFFTPDEVSEELSECISNRMYFFKVLLKKL
jgi:hypothetical protein